MTGEAPSSEPLEGPQMLAPAGLMTPRAHYSHGVATEEWVFVAGETATGPDGQLVGVDDITAQTTQTIANIAAVLAEVGLGLADIVSTTVYLPSFDHYRAFDAAYAAAFGDHRPARATLGCSLVHPALLVEIQAVAVRRRPSVP
jgi:2-iminobutanoate/2-iminopropanoate deaminase